MSEYIQSAVDYTRDAFSYAAKQVYNPNVPHKPLTERTKDCIVKFSKDHPYITAELGLLAASMVIGRISKAIAKQIKQNTILELDLDTLILSERPHTPSIFEQLDANATKKVHYRDVIEALELAAKVILLDLDLIIKG
jgi:hypothetical protein